MTNTNDSVTLHVHWVMKAITVPGVLFFGYYSILYLPGIFLIPEMALTYLIWGGFFGLIALYMLYVFFLSNTKIFIDQNGIKVTAPHGTYAMLWEEVVSFETGKFTRVYYGEDKAIGFNLLLAGKGKREFKEYNEQITTQYQFKIGRPEGVSNSARNKLIKKSKVGKGKLF